MPDTTVTITVAKKGEEPQTFSFECDGFLISEEQGIRSVYGKPYRPPEFQSNGHWRLAFKAWVGCQSYDAFVSGEQLDSPDGSTVVFSMRSG